ncbi:sugar MFS transporter [Dyadobacter psychrotolerans]|uniref:Glucose/galactose MFS transporter n=1 Tax=Dyadobacter psychrotolerans TaxID=2541721 RepID=A0A4R5DSH8_9BACT|nr:sugar MFS transporter [Dyadobacter psychrotolerans]TDE15220.1 glucose/galactose MFS transporter [Dyadobacter psychrotolerans]
MVDSINFTEGKQSRYIVIIGTLFFVFGFVSWLNAVLIPYFKLACQLTTQQAMLVAFAFYISYLIMALPSSYIIKKTGYKNGMVLGLWIMAAGALIFIPAAAARAYSLFLLGLFVQATGLTLLQTAANPYVTILGPIESAAMRMSVMGVCNKVAGAIAPLLLLSAVSKDPDEIDRLSAALPTLSIIQQNQMLDELAARLIVPYIALTIVLLTLGILIRLTSLPDIADEPEIDFTDDQTAKKTSLFQFPHLILGAVAIFCGVSVEVLAVDTIINYSEFQGTSFKEAKFFSTYTLLIMIISYIFGIFAIPKFISQRRALLFSAGIGILFTISAMILTGKTSVWMIALLGLGNALIWPAIWPLAMQGLGKFTKSGSALLIMGIVGGAVSPLFYGQLSDSFNPQIAYILLLPFYLFLLYYATSGYKAGKATI